MKKLVIVAIWGSCLAAYALPTYEPFTEYSGLVPTGGSAVDLATSGYYLTNGSVVEQWGGGSSGFGLLFKQTGADVEVTNNSATVFTSANLSTLLPSGFPGTGGDINITSYVPQNQGANNAGNSAVLKFAQDIPRPANGISTIYVSYLLDVTGQFNGATGANAGRYAGFLAQSNIYEGVGTGGFYTAWTSMFNSYGAGPTYVAYGEETNKPAVAGGQGDNIAPADSSTGAGGTGTSGVKAVYNTANFVVGCFTFTTGGPIKDTNTVWINPPLTDFGGPTPSTNNISAFTMGTVMSDVDAFFLESRSGGATGGIGPTFIGNLLIGTTWSYVTGGPEFTTQPVANVIQAPGTTVSLSANAVAAGQTVSYQWQHNGSNVNNGAYGAGGGGTVTGATLPNLTITGTTGGDSGTYTLVATASGTTFKMASSNAVITIADPAIYAQPQHATANYGGAASFTAEIVTTTAQLTYAWYDGAAMLVNGLQADGSTVSGAQGTNTGGTVELTLTLTNVSCADDGTYTLMVTNAANGSTSTIPASLTVNDPYIAIQPPATVEVVQGTTAVIPVTAVGTGGTSYQWYWNNGYGAQGNSGEITGSTTSALTISPASVNDVGTYYVVVSGTCGSPVTSSNAIVYFDTPITGATVSPAKLTQQTGTHLAFVATPAGGTGGLVNYQWQWNGINLTNGTQADQSVISGAVTATLVISNIQVADSGTYTCIAYNAANTNNSAFGTLTVSAGVLPLSTTNLVVTRIGEGSEPLSGATGNTLYLDQFTTNGVYVSTIMVPDSGTSALIVPGAGSDGLNEAYLTLSSNQAYLNIAGYFQNYPFTGGSDVTVGGAVYVRSIGAINGLGYYTLAYTNYGLYSGGNHFIRSAYSTDGLTNFWTTGAASGGSIKYVNAGPLGATYATGTGVPAMSDAVNGPICVGLAGKNLVFSDNTYPVYTDTNGLLGQSLGPPYPAAGLDIFSGAPFTDPAGGGATNLVYAGASCDFAFSPDLMTLYIADSSPSPLAPAPGGGGVQRWDLVGGVYTYQYILADTTSTLSPPTNGVRGLTVYWPPSITSWGPGVEGAVLYATTSEAVSNRLIKIIDNNGANSASTLLATGGANQFMRGVRFGPVSIPVSITTAPQPTNVYVGQSDDLTVAAGGDAPFFYQWQFDGTNIEGATTSSLALNNLQVSQSGTYSVIVRNAISAPRESAVVTVSPVTTAPQFAVSGPFTGLSGSLQLNFIGTAGTAYRIWASTNVALRPVTSTWTLVDSGTFSSGTNQFTVSATNQDQFFIITQP